MAKNPDAPKKPAKTTKSKAPKSRAPNSKASRPDVQPIGPALAELLNPAINRGESGLGSGTGLQPPPDNSWDRRAGGEAAAHRARASTRGAGEDVAKRDAATKSGADTNRDSSFSPPPAREARGGEGSGVGGVSARSSGSEFAAGTPHPRPLPAASRREGGRKFRLRRIAAARIRAGQLRHRRHHSDARSGTGKATRLHHRGGGRRGDGAAAAQQDGGAGGRGHRGCAGRADPRRPARVQGR